MKRIYLLALPLTAAVILGCSADTAIEAQNFVDQYAVIYQELAFASGEAEWAPSPTTPSARPVGRPQYANLNLMCGMKILSTDGFSDGFQMT